MLKVFEIFFQIALIVIFAIIASSLEISLTHSLIQGYGSSGLYDIESRNPVFKEVIRNRFKRGGYGDIFEGPEPLSPAFEEAKGNRFKHLLPPTRAISVK